MTTKALFSIVTITKDNAAGLRKTKQSLDAQMCRDFEWIVIDGASARETVNLLKGSKTTLISEPDDGLYDAMNKGIEKARGHFTLFLNAGDTLGAADTLDFIARKIVKTNPAPDFIYGDACELTNSGTKAKPARSHKNITRGMFTHHQAMFYRTENIGNLRYDTKYRIAADYDFTLRFLKTCTRVLYVPKALCIFEAGGISQTNARQGRNEQFVVRQTAKACPAFQNHLIKFMQTCLWHIRKTFPEIYWKGKSSRHF